MTDLYKEGYELGRQDEKDRVLKILDSFECNKYKNPLDRLKLDDDVAQYVKEQLSLISEIRNKLLKTVEK